MKQHSSLNFKEVYFFLDKIFKKCPAINLFVDCDTGWSNEENILRNYFQLLASKAAMVSIQNLKIGQKDNSFLSCSVSRIEEPEVVAHRLGVIAEACDNTLITLRLENNIFEYPLTDIIRYLKRIKELNVPFDCLLFHHKTQSITRLIEFSEKFYDLYPEDVKLVSVATAYINTPNLFDRLAKTGYSVVVIPNYSIRCEYSMHHELYENLIKQNFHLVNQDCSSMSDVLKFIYREDISR